MKKTEFIDEIAHFAALEKKQIVAVLDAITDVIRKQILEHNECIIPKLIKITKITKPAKPERPGIHPITRQPITFKAKPPKNVLKVRPLKTLKEMI